MTSFEAPGTRPRLRVGVLGAGPVTQAIHLPTLARLSDDFDVALVMDVDAATAEAVAGRANANFTTDADDVLRATEIDVVVVCSPPQFHAAQVIGACRAGVKAVLCEKPLAVTVDEAIAIAQVSEETGVPVIVGAQHTFDPAWLRAMTEWGSLPEAAHTIICTVVIPPNTRFEDLATDISFRAPVVDRRSAGSEADAQAVIGGIMGLAIHDLPLIRSFLGSSDAEPLVVRAEKIRPWGYVVTSSVSGRVVHLQSATTTTSAPEWTLEVIGDERSLHLAFPPSYVQGGSAIATVRTSQETRTFGPYPLSGYEAEWIEVARIARGEAAAPSPAVLVDDLRFAISLADQSSAIVRRREGAVA